MFLGNTENSTRSRLCLRTWAFIMSAPVATSHSSITLASLALRSVVLDYHNSFRQRTDPMLLTSGHRCRKKVKCMF